jgi:hypothetical protein
MRCDFMEIRESLPDRGKAVRHFLILGRAIVLGE